MSQQVQELIDKIKNEGVEEAEKKSQEIEHDAKAKASQIIDQAQKESERLISESKEEVKKMQEATEASLKQASRNMILALKEKVLQILQTIVLQDVKESLNQDQLQKLIGDVVTGYLKDNSSSGDVVVTLSQEDQDALGSDLLAKLKKKVKEGITLQSSDAMQGGFTVSFDDGKSSFDFSEESLAKFICSFLNERVAQLVVQS
jgi:V/A-type H+-transporting ATPase subunit E